MPPTNKLFFPCTQKKEPVGDDDALPGGIANDLINLTKEQCEPLSVFQLKKVRSLLDEAMAKNNDHLEENARVRDDTLREMGNWLHPSVPVSNDEARMMKNVFFRTCI